MPEQIAPAEHIKKVQQRIKNSPPKLELENRDVYGLLGDIKAED